ncbi:Fc.00g020480.m01.CDS01 [Cosmosporella sp. VM-42]
MEAIAELESIAQAAAYDDSAEEHPEIDTVRQYMDLFGLDEHEAMKKINELRGLMPEEGPKVKPKSTRAAAYLVKLQGQLPDAEAVKSIAGLSELPEVVTGSDDSGRNATFCRVDHQARSAIAKHFSNNCFGDSPTFFQLTLADKSLSDASAAPTLGLDTTMPQNRPESQDTVFRPTQDEYPVWYFFYGPLANPDELSIILRLSDKPQYAAATIKGGRLAAWNAIVDAYPGQGMADFQGKAFLVRTPKEEESLRFSVTDKFEVVRCKIRMTDQENLVDGLTLRHVGGEVQ